MNVIGLSLAVLTLWMGSAFPALAQTTEAEKKQFELIKAQAEKGDAQAQLSLGTLYSSGVGVSRDLSKAAKWHRKAAEQGLARAELRVAYEYADGIGVKADRREAVRWLRRAADQGLAEAQVELGACYANGDGIAENAVEAANWYRRAAEQSFPEGQYALGNCYFEGTGVTKDITEGVSWIRKAAEQGLAAAQSSFGLCYAKGKGVKQDYVEAYKWFNLAAAQGGEHDLDAKVGLSMAERAMTPEQIAQGQKLAREFKPRVAHDEAIGLAATPGKSHSAQALSPAITQPKAGFLSVKADDETSEVFLDGAFVGNTPAKLKLDPGTHLIEVKKAGFKDFRKQIHITEGSELSLHAVLAR